MSDTGWIVVGILGFVLVVVCYLAFTAYLDAKYPPRPPVRRERTRPAPPMWTSSTTTWTTKTAPEPPEEPEPGKKES